MDSAASVVFIVFPSRGPVRRIFRVPVAALGEDWPPLQRMLADHGAEFSFNDRAENRTLWHIGTRLGVASGGSDGPVWAQHEVIGDATQGDIVGVLCGTGD